MVEWLIYVDVREEFTFLYGLEDHTLPTCSLCVDRVTPPLPDGV